MTQIAADRVAAVHQAELDRFAARASRARASSSSAPAGSLVGGVPMTWMAKWAGGHPVYAATARGARIEDVDGNAYVDFSLGDTAAMAGHSPPPTVAAVQRRLGELGGATLCSPPRTPRGWARSSAAASAWPSGASR